MLLKLDDVHSYYGRSYILQGVNLEVGEGEIVALLGRNGAGKTTTMKTIMGIVKPATGKIIYKGKDIASLPSYKVARQGIAYAPQSRQLFPKMTVIENLKTGMRHTSSEEVLGHVFELFPVLQKRLSQRAGTLSGGEQQSLAIARALLTRPNILLLDEPTTGLMPIIVARLADIIRKLNGTGLAILLVEEKVPFALALAERVYFLVKGKIAHSDTKENLKGQKTIFLRYLGVEV